MDSKRLERSITYKKKDNGIDKRNMRSHRRSIEWKQMRDKTVSHKRGDIASPLSPLREVNQNEPPKTKEPKKKLTAAESRKEMLLKWRQEKELKKKIDAQEKAKKKPFKVSHVATATLPFRKTAASNVAPTKNKVETKATKPLPTRTSNIPSSVTTKPVSKTSSAAPKPEPTRRTTRSQPATKPEVKPTTRPAPAKPATKGRPVPKIAAPAPQPAKKATAATRGKADTKTAKGKPAAGKISDAKHKSPVRPVHMPNRKVMDSVTKTRGARISSSADYSFAPHDFQFTAPSRLQSFVFQPLSPSSAATFMCPNKDMTAVFSPPSTRRCSTPKLISNNPSKIRQSPHASAITEIISGSSDSEPEKVKSPVMKLVKQADKFEADADHKLTKSGRKSRRSTRASSVTTESKANNKTDDERAKSEKAEEVPKAAAVVSATAEVVESGNEAAMEEAMEEDKPVENTQDKAVDSTEEKGDKKEPMNKTPARRKSRGVGEKKTQLSKPQSLQEEILCGYTQHTENSENIAPLAEDVFLTPSQTAPRRQRTRSLGTAMLLKNSAKKFRTPKNNRNSLILKALSPEEGIEVLKHSPMIELTRRTPKNLNTTSVSEPCAVEPLPTFDNIEDDLKEAERSFSQQMQGDTSRVESTSETAVSGESEPVLPAASEGADTCNKEAEKSTEVAHDVNYFKNLMQTEIDSINVLCDKWDKYNDDHGELSEEARGHIRTATGKGHLLIKERFKKQFTGLIADCEFKTGFKETTCQDLQGFWEMVYYQVEDVYNMFKDLDKREANNWQEDKPQVVKKKVVKKKPAAAKPSKPAAKSGFAAFRAKMKQQQKQQEQEAEVKQPESEPASTKTFEGGFFSVNSPVKPAIAIHCEDSAKRKRGSTVSTSGSESATPAKMSRLDSDEIATETDNNDAHVVPDSIFTPEPATSRNNKRRSLRRSTRKSVSWNPTELEDTKTTNLSCSENNVSFSKFLVPSSSEPDMDDSVSAMDVDPFGSDDVDMASVSKRALGTEFDKHSNSAKKVTRRSVATPSAVSALRRLSSDEKSLSGRRKSRRSVHFSFSAQSPPTTDIHAKMPVTPFNKDSLVPRTRRSSQNTSTVDSALFTPPPATATSSSIFSPLRTTATTTTSQDTPSTRLAQLKVGGSTPVESPRRRSTRNSRRISGFTPPDANASAAPSLASVSEDPVTDLMSFSPAPAESKGTPRRSRRTRQSLL